MLFEGLFGQSFGHVSSAKRIPCDLGGNASNQPNNKYRPANEQGARIRDRYCASHEPSDKSGHVPALAFCRTYKELVAIEMRHTGRLIRHIRVVRIHKSTGNKRQNAGSHFCRSELQKSGRAPVARERGRFYQLIRTHRARAQGRGSAWAIGPLLGGRRGPLQVRDRCLHHLQRQSTHTQPHTRRLFALR